MPPPTLNELQRRALALAEAERWHIVAQASTGAIVELRTGRPGRRLVLLLAQTERQAEGQPP